jgi:putative addiction module component (TIGR02574 family)
MSETAKKLLPTLLALSPKDTAQIARQLIEQMEEEDEEAAFVAELNRRMAELRSGKVKAVPSEEVHRKLRAKYG